MAGQVGPSPDGGVGIGPPTINPFANHLYDGGVGISGPPVAGAPAPNSAGNNEFRDEHNPVFRHDVKPLGNQQPPADFDNTQKSYNVDFTFYHPKVGYLTTEYGVNYVSWDYKLNTQHYSTYAGEVVQILSVAVDDIIIRGQIATYAQMELMFKYFARYMERATQGSAGTAYDETPIRVTYPMRQWDFYIQPKDMVGFNYGRNVVAPEWQITAAVYDINPNIEKELTTALAHSYLQVTDAVGVPNPTASALDDAELPLTGTIGFNPENPFSNPFPEQGITGKTDPRKEIPIFSDYGKVYNEIIQGFATGDYHSVFDKFGSVPNIDNGKGKAPTPQKTTTQPTSRH